MPSFDRVRKTSTSERFKPSLAAIKAGSRAEMANDVRTNNNAGVDRLTVVSGPSAAAGAGFRQSASFGSPRMLLQVPQSVSTIYYLQ